ncbi:MAG: M1 family metallopeptidase [Acidithiobacillales bacterium]
MKVSRQERSHAALGVFAFVLAGLARPTRSGEVTLQELTALRPEASGLDVGGLTLERDAFRFEFSSGAFFPLPSLGGRVVGGVFLGVGRMEVTPSGESERRHLALLTADDRLRTLTGRFEEAVLLFTDDSASQLLRPGHPAVAAVSSHVTDVYEAFLKKERKDLKHNVHLRILSDLLEDSPKARGVFIAYVKPSKLPPAVAVFDPRGLPASGFPSDLGTETTALYVVHDERGGFYYSSTPRGAGPPGPVVADADALRYEVDTTIRPNRDVSGTSTIRVRFLRDGVRLLRLQLFPKLRIRAAEMLPSGGPALPLPFVQGKENEDGESALLLPPGVRGGEEAALRISYDGDQVIDDVGLDLYAVQARQSWYANLGTFMDVATFDLTYRVPKKYEVLSVGRPVGKTVEGSTAVYRFRAERPIRVAGFNYGVFKSLERKDEDSSFRLRVYTKEGKGEQFAESALVDGINAARTGVAYFGALPENDVAISQQAQWFFGQSWPGLVFLPSMAFISSYERVVDMGLGQATDFVNNVGYHEFAHQWWGHNVGWATYRDQWLSEGFAEFATALVIQAVEGSAKYCGFWKRARKKILERGRLARLPNCDAGPISLGFRLQTSEAPEAAAVVMYEKGAFVLQMLRAMTWEPRERNHDVHFIAMLKDFSKEWAGRSPTTDDFRRVAEKYMPPSGGGDLAWFFRQWVEGTDIPKLRQSLHVTESGGGKYRIGGDLAQGGVPDDFRSFVPIYAEFERGQFARIGGVTLLGSRPIHLDAEISLPRKPRSVEANCCFDLLTKD